MTPRTPIITPDMTLHFKTTEYLVVNFWVKLAAKFGAIDDALRMPLYRQIEGDQDET
jgi:hypothetical protein